MHQLSSGRREEGSENIHNGGKVAVHSSRDPANPKLNEYKKPATFQMTFGGSLKDWLHLGRFNTKIINNSLDYDSGEVRVHRSDYCCVFHGVYIR